MQNKSVKISRETREAYERRRLALEREGKQDPDAPMLPIEYWERGVIGKYYRPKKEHVNVRIDSDIMAWLRSGGAGHLTRINEILREAMMARQRKARR